MIRKLIYSYMIYIQLCDYIFVYNTILNIRDDIGNSSPVTVIDFEVQS